jgi:3-hydroxyethyl bacteriochlorophyllide a dehydrogenase
MESPPTPAATVPSLSARAIVFDEPEALSLRQLALPTPQAGEVVVDVEWTGISTGTEKLFWTGRMPPFPGMGYPLVPGYETIGRVSACGSNATVDVGERVFVSGARCFGEIRGLFGGAASRLVVDNDKVLPVGDVVEAEGVLLALAATAHHALYAGHSSQLPDLIIGHGVLGRLMARLTLALSGRAPVVWETDERRTDGAAGYAVTHPDNDDRRDYALVIDASGDPGILDKLIQHLGRRGEIVLAGFYSDPLSFQFAPAFMREASISVAAEWNDTDLSSVKNFVDNGALSLTGLITHLLPASEAQRAYPTAFSDPECLKMVLDWRNT